MIQQLRKWFNQFEQSLNNQRSESYPSYPSWSAYEPNLIPPLELMHLEGIDTLEEWFRWAEEWSMLLRVYGKITRTSHVLEIGCGLGRIAFPLRYILSSEGSYNGFEICKNKVDFLKKVFQPAHYSYSIANYRKLLKKLKHLGNQSLAIPKILDRFFPKVQ